MTASDTESMVESAAVGLRDVENFWSSNPCNSSLGTSKDRQQYFLEIENQRYSHEGHILEVGRFESFAGKRVLEIGCGVGTDGRRFSKGGAKYVGINLDRGSSNLSREALDLFCLEGSILQMDGERLGFANNSLDHVYSFGVIHHSPNPGSIVREISRVLKPGGSICVMLYHRNSVNYYFEIMFLRKLFRLALVPKFAPAFLSAMLGLNREKLEKHRAMLLTKKLSKQQWVSANTDGPDCPLAAVYSKSEAGALFSEAGLVDLEYDVRFFDRTHYGKLGRLIPDALANYLARRWGWHLIIRGTKPVSVDVTSK